VHEFAKSAIDCSKFGFFSSIIDRFSVHLDAIHQIKYFNSVQHYKDSLFLILRFRKQIKSYSKKMIWHIYCRNIPIVPSGGWCIQVFCSMGRIEAVSLPLAFECPWG
jgi:hypothetical protein